MADALCGPSNALQNFQKHSSADRTLQQDRLIGRPQPAQGFRSAAGPSVGALDHEFEAFQNGQLPLQRPEHPGFAPAGFHTTYTPAPINNNSPAAWATDFQHLNLGGPTPAQQIGQLPQANHLAQAGGWQNEFNAQFAQQNGYAAGATQSQQMNYSVPFQRLSSINALPPSYQHMSQGSTMPNQEYLQQTENQPVEAFDDEAFQRAFDAAAFAAQSVAQEELQADESKGKETELQANLNEEVVQTERIGADLIHDPSAEAHEEVVENENDAMARTAAELLESVRDEQSEKFKNSNFFQLMRQFRDRQVEVRGDKIMGVMSQEDKDFLEESLHTIARQLSQLDFARVEPLLASNPRGFYQLDDQLVIGEFVRTLMRASAALEKLQAQFPDFIHHAKPFGLSIGQEVFALASNPIINNYPALRDLVISFKRQFSELGIDPGMVRRVSDNASINVNSHAASSSRATPHSPSLQEWVANWLATNPGHGYNWLLSPSQFSSLLGPDLYDITSTPTTIPSFPYQGTSTTTRTTPPPTQAHLDMLLSILGPHIVTCMMRHMGRGRAAGMTGWGLGFFARMLLAYSRQSIGSWQGQTEWTVGEEVTLEKAFPKHPLGEYWNELEWLEMERGGGEMSDGM